jgi:hypothetical protein
MKMGMIADLFALEAITVLLLKISVKTGLTGACP